jgi:hypothetical protein
MDARRPVPADPALIAFACLLLPLAVVHLCYTLAVAGGHLPLCIPYLQGCTSISATGRYGVAYFVFKGGMLPTAVLLGIFWWLVSMWLAALGDTGVRARRWMLALGLTGAAFLALYTVFLGHKGEVYNLLRRFGVTLYFGSSYLAALLLTGRVRELRDRVPRSLARAMLVLVSVLLLLGLGSIPVSNFIANKDPVENAIEWVFTLLLVAFYGLVGLAFRATGFRLTGEVRPPGQ